MSPKLKIPKVAKRPKTLKNHGQKRVDNYFWLRDKENPEVIRYLKDENKYFEAKMKPLVKLKAKLFTEMKSRIKEDDATVPAPYGDFVYYTKFQKGKQYSINCRKLKKSGKEEVYFDENVLAKGKKYFNSSGHKVSPDQKLLMYSTDFDGSERYDVRVKEIATGHLLPDVLKSCSGSFVWANDGRTIFYVVADENLRPTKVFRHVLGQDPKDDQMVFEEKDLSQFLHVSKTQDDAFIFIESNGKTTSENWYLSADTPFAELKCFHPREEDLEYSVEHRHGHFWILTNLKAENFQIMKCPVEKTAKKYWKTFYKNSRKVYREGFLILEGFLVMTERENGLPQIRVYDFAKKKDHQIKFEDAAYTVGLGANLEFATDILRIHYASPITPDSTIDYNMLTRKKDVRKTKEVKGHKKSKYICNRVWVKGHDGVKIPMTLVYLKTLKLNGKAPGYLYGYGSYGMNIPDSFPSRRDMYRLIDRGFVYALAHPRGGSDMGRDWYEDGKFLKKKNTFKDFIACGEYLKKKNYVAKDKLAACGGSAGGMLMGACVNMRPDLFKVVAAHVPFVDVVNTMLDRDLPLTQLEYKEWGNPEEKKYFKYMLSYSPYDNVEKKAYPNLFITCGLNDPRVTYWEPAKWVAKLRELKTDQNTLVFKTNMGFGHFGASGRFEHLHEQAEEFAFILGVFGSIEASQNLSSEPQGRS
jgi:oligopeptidase B